MIVLVWPSYYQLQFIGYSNQTGKIDRTHHDEESMNTNTND